MAPFASILKDKHNLWLRREIPHRICATMAWLPLSDKWTMPPAPRLPQSNFHVWCMGRSIDEGRKAGLRWLSEFVGIKMGEKNQAAPVTSHRNGKSVSIECLGGTKMDHDIASALTVAKAWQACSQSSMHPTTNTSHSDIGPQELKTALVLILEHLEINLYQPLGYDLPVILRNQERLAAEQSW